MSKNSNGDAQSLVCEHQRIRINIDAGTAVTRWCGEALDYDGKIYVLGCGYWLKFAIRRVDRLPEVPHGMRYSFSRS